MRTRWDNWPLRVQLGLTVVLIMVALLIGFGALLYSGVANYLHDQASRQLRAQSQAVVSAVWTNAQPAKPDRPGADIGPREREQLATLADALSSPTNSAVVYLPDSSIVATGVNNQASAQTSPQPPSRNEAAFNRALRGETVEAISIVANQRQLILYEPIEHQQMVVAVAQVATSLQSGDDLLYQLLVWLIGGISIAVAVALVLVLGTVRAVLHPLDQLLVASQRVAAGDLTVRSGFANNSEIGRLGAAFDHMVAQVQNSFITQRRFVADAAHELRTPLTAMSGQTELLLMGAASEPQRQRYVLQRINGEIERMVRLVNDLLTLSRLDSQSTLQNERIDLGALVREIAEEFAPLLASHHFTYHATTPMWIHGDTDRLRQVLFNLLDNARKYTPTGGIIRLNAKQDHQYVILEIGDSGVGIPSNDIDKVWDRFYRVDQARTRTTGGSGLGLAIVKSIVNAHNGSVALESIPGQGTTVTVSLPQENTRQAHGTKRRVDTQPESSTIL